MKKIFLVLIWFTIPSLSIFSQLGQVKIYDQQTYGIRQVQIFQSQDLKNSSLYIQFGLINANQNNDAGRIYKLDKSSLEFYSAFRKSFDRFWNFVFFPTPRWVMTLQNPFAVSMLDTHTALANYLAGCSGAVDCGDQTSYSTNFGRSWNVVHQLTNGFLGVLSKGYAFDPKDTNLIYSIYPKLFPGGSYNQAIYKSTNKGLNWLSIDSIYTNLMPMPEGYTRVNPFRTNYLYTRGYFHILVSSNSGMNFDTAVGSNSFDDMKYNRSDSTIIAHKDSLVYRSTNHGVTWTHVSTMTEKIRTIAINYDNPSWVYAGTANGLYISLNGGLNWVWFNNSFSPSKNVIGINSDAGMGDTVYAVTNDAVYKVWGFYTGLNNINLQIPSHFSLSQNYPNPFNPMTNIKFDIPKSVFVKLTVFDVLGREVQTLVNEQLSPGTYNYDFNASHLPSGIYYYKLESNEFIQTKKMVLIK